MPTITRGRFPRAAHETDQTSHVGSLPHRRVMLPCGVDVRANSVSIYSASRSRSTLITEKALTVPTNGDPVRALTDLLAALRLKDRRAIGSVSTDYLKTAPFELNKNFPAEERLPAAEIEISKALTLPREQRTVRLQAISAETFAILATRKQDVDACASMLKNVGLQPIAVDCAPQAWSRIVNGGLIEDDPQNPLLVLHSKGVPLSFRLPAAADDKGLAAAIRQHITATMKERQLDDDSLTYWTPAGAQVSRYEALTAQLSDLGLLIKPLTIGNLFLPTWAYAYALASWNFKIALSGTA